MAQAFFTKKWRRAWRWAKKHKPALLASAVFLVLMISLSTIMTNRRLSVDPTSYSSLLDLIAEAESKGNYNAYFGNAGNTQIDFTQMSIAQVQEWQREYVEQGSPSSAVGRYQIISTTLAGLVEELELDTEELFDASMQDRMAIALLERRGAEAYVNSELSRKDFAANLAKEWAALPSVVGDNPSASYYAGDGLNKSLVGVDEILGAIAPIRPK